MPPLPTTYADALEWLYARTRGGRPRDPQRVRPLLDALRVGMPPRAVHVVGTNGKGTVTSMLAAAYRASGVRTGRFLSPHVEDFRERIEVDGEPVREEEVLDFVRRAAALDLPVPPSFFELVFALALERFAAAGVEMAVVEAGVGARADVTILLENVRAVVLTQVARDHLDVLGPSLQDVIQDKVEAVRPGVPVVTAARDAVLEVVAQTASMRRSPLFMDIPSSRLFELPPGFEDLRERDRIRWGNARLAAAALRILGDVDDAALAEGLRVAPLPGRCERFEVHGRHVVLDGAHDPSAAEALAAALEPPYALVFGSLPKKRGEDTLRVLEAGASRVWVAPAAGSPITVADAQGRERCSSPLEALQRALGSVPAGGRVVVAGSLYLAGELRPALRALAGGAPLASAAETPAGAPPSAPGGAP